MSRVPLVWQQERREHRWHRSLWRIGKLGDTPKGTVPAVLAPFLLPHKWDAAHVKKIASLPDIEPIVALLRKVSSDSTAISDALSQRYFSHAHGATQTVGA